MIDTECCQSADCPQSVVPTAPCACQINEHEYYVPPGYTYDNPGGMGHWMVELRCDAHDVHLDSWAR